MDPLAPEIPITRRIGARGSDALGGALRRGEGLTSRTWCALTGTLRSVGPGQPDPSVDERS